VPFARRALIALLLVVPLALAAAGCGDDGDGGGRAGTTPGGDVGATRLTITGVRTAASAEPVPEPEEIPFRGTLDCETAPPTGTGIYADTAPDTCRTLATHRADFATLDADVGRICTEIYGGPQLARITGTVAGEPIDVEVARNDGCGIDDWDRLEWLLGPPEE
jgi:hypothetical protein